MLSIPSKSTGRWLVTTLWLISSLVLASCATGYGNRGGYGQRYPASSYVDLVGTVVGVERGYDRIVLQVHADGYHDRGGQVEIRYNPRTILHYQGRAYPVEGLEPGDEIRIEGRRSGDNLVAESIDVLRNVREHRGVYEDDRYGDDRYGDDYDNGYGNERGQEESLQGTVRYVEPRNRVISLDVDYGERVWVRYDERTIVEFNGRRFQPMDIERGDFVRVEAQRYGDDWVAEVIHVQRDSTHY